MDFFTWLAYSTSSRSGWLKNPETVFFVGIFMISERKPMYSVGFNMSPINNKIIFLINLDAIWMLPKS